MKRAPTEPPAGAPPPKKFKPRSVCPTTIDLHHLRRIPKRQRGTIPLPVFDPATKPGYAVVNWTIPVTEDVEKALKRKALYVIPDDEHVVGFDEERAELEEGNEADADFIDGEQKSNASDSFDGGDIEETMRKDAKADAAFVAAEKERQTKLAHQEQVKAYWAALGKAPPVEEKKKKKEKGSDDEESDDNGEESIDELMLEVAQGTKEPDGGDDEGAADVIFIGDSPLGLPPPAVTRAKAEKLANLADEEASSSSDVEDGEGDDADSDDAGGIDIVESFAEVMWCINIYYDPSNTGPSSVYHFLRLAFSQYAAALRSTAQPTCAVLYLLGYDDPLITREAFHAAFPLPAQELRGTVVHQLVFPGMFNYTKTTGITTENYTLVTARKITGKQ